MKEKSKMWPCFLRHIACETRQLTQTISLTMCNEGKSNQNFSEMQAQSRVTVSQVLFQHCKRSFLGTSTHDYLLFDETVSSPKMDLTHWVMIIVSKSKYAGCCVRHGWPRRALINRCCGACYLNAVRCEWTVAIRQWRNISQMNSCSTTRTSHSVEKIAWSCHLQYTATHCNTL